jgi:hypothetical protein
LIFRRREPAGGERAGQLPFTVEQIEQHRGGARVADALKRVGDRPPAAARAAVGADERARQPVVRPETNQRIRAEAHGLDAGRLWIAHVIGVDATENVGVDVRRDHRADRLRRGLVRDQPERFGSAALDSRIGIRQRGHQRRRRCGIADQSHGERRHLPHFGIGVRLQGRGQRRNAFRRFHASDRERGSAAHISSGIADQRREIATATA